MVTPSGMYPTAGGYLLQARATPQLVLLPGIEGDARIFSRQCALARQHPALALHLPTDVSSLQQAAAVLLSRIPMERFAIFGVSLGGLVGWAASILDPGRVRALITLGTLPHPRFIPRILSPVRWAAALLPAGAFREAYRRHLWQKYQQEGIHAEEFVLLESGFPTKAVWLERLGMIERWGLGEMPSVPTLWMRGQFDVEAPWSLNDAARALPQALLQVVPGGHRAHLTHPTALHGFMAHFLRGVPQ